MVLSQKLFLSLFNNETISSMPKYKSGVKTKRLSKNKISLITTQILCVSAHKAIPCFGMPSVALFSTSFFLRRGGYGVGR